MNYRYVGRSGLRVSPICLGTMTFGYKCDKTEAFKIMDTAYATGINFFDTAEIYPVPPTAERAGDTETIVGEWLAGKPRDSVIIATKVAGAASGWFVPPIRHGLTAIDAFHINKAVEGSLRRLKTDYIDLYQVHWPDTIVPIDESLKTLDTLVSTGKVRYIGVSNETSYGLTKALYTSYHSKLKRYESIQNNFSLLNRRFLDELALVCKQEQVSLLPYSPIAGGVLTGKYNKSTDWSNFRYGEYKTNVDQRMHKQIQRFANKRCLNSTARYIDIAERYDISPATLAVAWSMNFDFVASTIIGATTANQLTDSLQALEVTLGSDIIAECDAVHAEILYPMG
ncbi:aldo/keto reductase [Achromatium sp. WMS1]|nr:aldo/keto reductase [Achromatium sp. WMS1]